MDATRLTDPDRYGVGSAYPLFERERPLALAHPALERARVGRGSVRVLDGTAGTGKSSLLTTVREAPPGEIAVLSATGRELERDFAFSVVVQLFESRLAGAPEDERARLLAGPARAALPLFARHPRDTFSDGSFSLLHGLGRLCANLAEPTGLAILVDDVELADRASLRFLLYLTERLEQVPVALLLASGSAARSPTGTCSSSCWGTRRRRATAWSR